MDAGADLVALAVAGGCGMCAAATLASAHDIPHPIGDPEEDEGLPGEDDDDEDEDDDEEDEEPMQV
jgi:hypothetical protein